MKKRSKGFTVAEVLVATSLTLLVMGMIVLIVTNMLNKYKVAQIKLEMERNVNLAMDEIAKELKQATLVVGNSYLTGIVQIPDQTQPRSDSLYFTVTSPDYDPLSAQSFDFEKNYRQIRYFLSGDKKVLYKQVLGLDKDGKVKEDIPLSTKNITTINPETEGKIIFSATHSLFDSSKPYHEIDNPYQMELFEVKIEIEYEWGKFKNTYSATNKVKLEMP